MIYRVKFTRSSLFNTACMGLFRKNKKTGSWLALVPQRDGIAAVRLAHGPSGSPAVELAAFFPGGTDAETLEKAGKESRAASFRCTTLLGAGDYQLISTDAPNVPAAEVKTAVRWRLKDLIDFPADEATIDVLEIPADPNAAGRQRMMFVVAARSSVIAPRQKLFAQAKAELSVIDIPEMAQRNVAAMLEPQGRGLAMLSFDQDGGLLTVTYGGELYLSRRIDLALGQLLDTDHERRMQSFDRITLELQRSLDNFERQFSFISVAKLVLGPSTVEGLDAYLSSNLYTPVETLDLASIFDLERVPEFSDMTVQQRFFLPLGAAMRNEEGAN